MSYRYGDAANPRTNGIGRRQSARLFRVRDLIRFLEQRWGKAEAVKYPPWTGGPLAGRQGIILFEVSGWRDAQGHATLFNGRTCYDHCYFNEPGARYRTDCANFWSLS
ncbi:T6SS effector amidase Tae4 family protein [Burkholderia latens]|uniref:T6SS effector amidase Tae4 family protein n=1 Tax=Burkholderia latens TaxID=488446 RepID=UPI001ABAB824|nr:T6SS effector amidase Tae4 family protein [Burkholderia latens]